MRWFACAALVGTPVAAQDVDPARDGGTDIVVTATPLLDAGEDIVRLPARHASDEQIAAAHATDLTDYLRRMVGGVSVNEIQGNPLQPDIGYRGFTASPLLGTPQGLSVYMDGVRVNQPFGDVVSWDLIPTSAIRSTTLVSGANPLFGRNSLGGALVVRTKDGRSDPGMTADVAYGSFGRTIARATVGGHADDGLHAFAAADYFAERGWRAYSRSRAAQLFGKLGWADARTDIAVAATVADTTLSGNGLQELRLLARDPRSVYTHPDTTRNRAWSGNLTLKRDLSDRVRLDANAFRRAIRTRTLNGDLNDGSLGENPYQPDAGERAALAAAGYRDVPAAGESQANTPFPRWRCIADILLDDEPNETCNGLVNRSATRQTEAGGTAELAWRPGGHMLTLGIAYVDGRATFGQSAQFGYLMPDRGIATVAGPGAFADGSQDSENAFDARVDLSARTRVFSGYTLAGIAVTRTLHADLSARFDDTIVRNRDRITPGGGTGSLDGDHRFRRLNPAAALRWTPVPALAMDAALAQTSRAPSAIELGCADPDSPCRLPNALAGDPPLAQVVARTVEGGVTLTAGGLTARGGGFRTVSRDDILFVADDQAGFGYFRNFGRTRRQGADVDLGGRIGPLTLSAHYTFLDATYRSGEVVGGAANSSGDAPAPGFEGRIAIAPGDRIPLIPRHLVKAGIAGDPLRWLTLSADLIASAGVVARGNENGAHRPDGVYYLGAGRTDGYVVAGLGVDVRPTRGFALYLRISNLFDRSYATAAQLGATGFDAAGTFVARPFGGPAIDGERPLRHSTLLAPGAPRSVQGGMRLAF
ncbi:TonB-dependent receptor [Sphingomonas sp. A2-49]|uniref:TonB-dependent receptor n=1 Tax=Sphingomonas sp. A2-49 TaxID=1391375 RepID=UPI0021D10BD9|nr:TonB-dependent receptor [Sphingomonas sp. A2-49]MCU6454570.1 TonB-dependent receptor [Sphingomonas sp. A2-49]